MSPTSSVKWMLLGFPKILSDYTESSNTKNIPELLFYWKILKILNQQFNNPLFTQ